MKKQLAVKEIQEMFNVAGKMIVTGQAGLMKICKKKALELGLGKIDRVKVVTALIEDYENSRIFIEKKESYHGSAFALFLNLEISKI